MAVKTIEIRVCDKCNKELVGRLTYRVCPCCDAEVCLACIEKANSKQKPKERKTKEKPITAPPVETSDTTPVDISTFKTKVGQDGGDYEVSMGGIGIVCGNLKRGCHDLLLALNIDEEYVENSPDSDGKNLLLSILKEA